MTGRVDDARPLIARSDLVVFSSEFEGSPSWPSRAWPLAFPWSAPRGSASPSYSTAEPGSSYPQRRGARQGDHRSACLAGTSDGDGRGRPEVGGKRVLARQDDQRVLSDLHRAEHMSVGAAPRELRLQAFSDRGGWHPTDIRTDEACVARGPSHVSCCPASALRLDRLIGELAY